MQESSPMYITRNYRNSMTCPPGCFGATRLALGFNSYDRNRMRNQTQNQCKKRSYVVPVLIGDKPLIIGKKGLIRRMVIGKNGTKLSRSTVYVIYLYCVPVYGECINGILVGSPPNLAWHFPYTPFWWYSDRHHCKFHQPHRLSVVATRRSALPHYREQ